MIYNNGSLDEITIDVTEDVNIIEFTFTAPDENGTTIVETDSWELNFSETYFHTIGSLQLVGNLPCGR